jgi:hypothetical protein
MEVAGHRPKVERQFNERRATEAVAVPITCGTWISCSGSSDAIRPLHADSDRRLLALLVVGWVDDAERADLVISTLKRRCVGTDDPRERDA